MKNAAPNEVMFSSWSGPVDLSTFSDMNTFLEFIWNDSFMYWDHRISTPMAQDMATKTQDRAERFWRYHNA